jgi:hypothetical protein
MPWERGPDMKILLGFFIGTTVALLVVLLIFHSTPPILTENGSTTASSQIVTTTVTVDSNVSTVSDRTDSSSLLPDVKQIDENALGAPYRQVESEITDPDIANYFHTLMAETGLDKAGLTH